MEAVPIQQSKQSMHHSLGVTMMSSKLEFLRLLLKAGLILI